MSWRTEKTKTGSDLVYDGVEFGISPSPHKGTANIQNANISTESGEVLASYSRTAQHQTALTNQTLTPNGATDFTGPSTLKAGTWISVSASTVTSISATTSPTTDTANYLVIGGGGGGGVGAGTGAGGGGGAGQVVESSSSFSVGTFAITVGNGGTGGTSGSGASGSSSIIAGIVTAYGGGGGGAQDSNGVAAVTGGSGGGAGAVTGGASRTGGAGAGGGYAGGNGNPTTRATGGGGGGSNAVGANGSASVGGNGGAGTSSSITGTATIYAGGGGGGATDTATAGTGGTGGGGNGTNGQNAGVGTANTGSGGGGAGGNFNGGNGGSGKVVISYAIGSMVAVGGDVSIVGTNMVHVFNESGSFRILSISKTNLYYVSYKSGTTFRLSSKFDPTGANALSHGITGSITFSTVTAPNQGVAKATEKYTTASATEYRYYILDANSYVWVWDTAINETYGTQWMLPDPIDYSSSRLTGLGVLNGYLLAVGKAFVTGKPTPDLGRPFSALSNAFLNEPFPTHNNFALVGKQGKMYYCDGNYIGEIFPTTSLITSIANIQSTSSYTSSTTTGTVSAVISGSLPYSPDGTRIPAIFYTDRYGTQPTNLSTFTVYYIKTDPASATFEVYSSSTSTIAIDIATGAAGNQYFTTFWPYGDAGDGGSTPTVQISTQRVNLPANETAQCMVEVGNTVIIGGKTTTLYPWNQIDATPSDFIELPEADVKTMINVNNMAYVFPGNKGNIYITNNAVASLALKVPDYCAGVPGTPLTYIEPTFTWGDADYVRGRVYFSILDQTATKAGNCGGVWSFVPTQNIDPSQEIGMALRLENQQSYGSYNGYATIILPNQEQTVTSPQYWAAWQDGVTNPNYGIDGTGTTPVTQYVVETDLLPSGTMLEKGTFQQLEYKLTTALASGDSVQLYYRTNSTDAWTSCGTVQEETSEKISGYFNQIFQKTQYLQFRIVVSKGEVWYSALVVKGDDVT